MSNEIEKDKLRRGDHVLIVFGAPGVFCYILQREGQTFFFYIIPGKGVNLRYWPPESDQEITAVRTVLACLGFTEFPIFKTYEGDKSFRSIPGGKLLLDSLAEYDLDSAKRVKEAEKAAKKKKKDGKGDPPSGVQPGSPGNPHVQIQNPDGSVEPLEKDKEGLHIVENKDSQKSKEVQDSPEV